MNVEQVYQEDITLIPRTRWDQAWFIVTETVSHVANFLTFSLCILLGVKFPAVLQELWTGSPAATAGVLLGLAFCVMVLELIKWGVRESTEWLMATLEELFSRAKEEDSGHSPSTVVPE